MHECINKRDKMLTLRTSMFWRSLHCCVLWASIYT